MLNRVSHDEWFCRVWVFQEYALSQQEPHCLLGGQLFTLKSLSKSSSMMEDEFCFPICERFDHMENMSGLLYGVSEISLPRQILTLLYLTTDMECRRPHDHIYGTLGLVQMSQQAENSPKADYKLPVGDVFEE